MSNYIRKTKRPDTGKFEYAHWRDDHFGKHHYGVEFMDGKIFDPRKDWGDKEIETKMGKIPEKIIAKFFGIEYVNHKRKKRGLGKYEDHTEDAGTPAVFPIVQPHPLRIQNFIHCKSCLDVKNMKSVEKLAIGNTPEGIQVWCETCQQSVIDLDFMGHKVQFYQGSED